MQKPPASLSEFYAQAEPSKWLEKSVQDLWNGEGGGSTTKGKGSKEDLSPSPKQNRAPKGRSPQEPQDRNKGDLNYTHLMTSAEHIYVISDKSLFKKPPFINP